MTVDIEQRKTWDLRPGNTVKVWLKIKEKDKVRLQAFEGFIIAHKHGLEPGATFTVRKVSGGVGVERIFPVFSPNIEKIEITKRAKVRRSKLYYIREKAAKQIRKKMKQIKFVEKKEATEAVHEEKNERLKKEEEKLENETTSAEEQEPTEEKTTKEETEEESKKD